MLPRDRERRSTRTEGKFDYGGDFPGPARYELALFAWPALHS